MSDGIPYARCASLWEAGRAGGLGAWGTLHLTRSGIKNSVSE